MAKQTKQDSRPDFPKQDLVKTTLEGILPKGCRFFCSNWRKHGFTIEFKGDGSEDAVTFDQLSLISDTFGTKLINLGSDDRRGGVCDTCSYNYSVMLIRVDGISKGYCN